MSQNNRHVNKKRKQRCVLTRLTRALKEGTCVFLWHHARDTPMPAQPNGFTNTNTSSTPHCSRNNQINKQSGDEWKRKQRCASVRLTCALRETACLSWQHARDASLPMQPRGFTTPTPAPLHQATATTTDERNRKRESAPGRTRLLYRGVFPAHKSVHQNNTAPHCEEE